MEDKKSTQLKPVNIKPRPGIIKRALTWFDHFEDRNRHRLSKHPLLYAFIGGFSVVLFWRGVWMFADGFSFMTPIASLIGSIVVMLATGTFVSFFIGEQIIISGLKEEKRVDQKTEEDLKREEWHMKRLVNQIEGIRTDIAEMKKTLTRLTRVKKEDLEKIK